MQFHFPLDRSLSTGSYIQENSLLKEKKCNGIFLPFILRFLHREKKKFFKSFQSFSKTVVIYRSGERRVTTAVWQVREWAADSGSKGAGQLLLPAWCSCLLREGLSLQQVLQLARQRACQQSTECSLIPFSCLCLG